MVFHACCCVVKLCPPLPLLLCNPFTATLPLSILTTRPGGFCFPHLEPGALASPIHYSVTKFPCKSGSLLRYISYTVHTIAQEDLPIHSTSFAFSGSLMGFFGNVFSTAESIPNCSTNFENWGS